MNMGELGMALRKKDKGHDAVITAASQLYMDSVRMFAEAERKIDDANLKLDATIDEIDAAITDLQTLRLQAETDKQRNSNFKGKLQEFTLQ